MLACKVGCLNRVRDHRRFLPDLWPELNDDGRIMGHHRIDELAAFRSRVVSGATPNQVASVATGVTDEGRGASVGSGTARASTATARAACQASSIGGTVSTAELAGFAQRSRGLPETRRRPIRATLRGALTCLPMPGRTRKRGARHRLARRIAKVVSERGIDGQRSQRGVDQERREIVPPLRQPMTVRADANRRRPACAGTPRPRRATRPCRNRQRPVPRSRSIITFCPVSEPCENSTSRLADTARIQELASAFSTRFSRWRAARSTASIESRDLRSIPSRRPARSVNGNQDLAASTLPGKDAQTEPAAECSDERKRRRVDSFESRWYRASTALSSVSVRKQRSAT